MRHIKYPKIPTPNSTQGTALINHIRSIYGGDSKMFWPTEKLHGTNFAIYLNRRGDVKFASRNQFVGDDYYGAQPVIEDAVGKLGDLFGAVALHESRGQGIYEKYEDLEQVVLYGEIIGRGVQKGILYDVKGLGGRQDRALVFLDLLTVWDNDCRNWMSLADLRGLLHSRGLNAIEPAPPMSLVEALAEDPETASGYATDGSQREGNVYRFCDPNACGPHGERLMFKIKGGRFLEVSRLTRKPRGVEVDGEFAADAVAHINANRMESAMSRIGLTRETFRPSKFGDLLREMGTDVLADMDRRADKAERKFVMTECKNLMKRELF